MTDNRFKKHLEDIEDTNIAQKSNLSEKIIDKINKPIERETGISESFYLSKKVSNQLKILSKQTGKSKSYIVNSILEASLEEFLL